ncbi:glutathione S-transferase family protein [Chitiniphilus eburneus]|uniref:Glutathione S-transferase family protein n=1 Tax=Chitiniphilus eburneus TaxID=2571148 RepID=A0A4U0PTJ7_9NEIS|nr:glutathione S-transferase family protein [Chitiniphilus eburneus]TJZ71707.1 glutathione S-transferase family protein [Chitiniphilus eburneus]
MLVLHQHPLSSYCWKALIALYEKDLPFEARRVDLGNPDVRAAFARLWPSAKIPLLQDGDRVVPETSIMIEYLDLHFPESPRLLPEAAEARLQVRLWDRLFDQYVMTPMQRFIAQRLRPDAARDPLASEAALDDLLKAYELIESRLGGDTWAVGETFTLADCAAAPALFYAFIVQPPPATHRVLHEYFERLMARASMQRVLREAQPWFRYFPLNDRIPARFLDPLNGGGTAPA